jgi:hypothetical protein
MKNHLLLALVIAAPTLASCTTSVDDDIDCTDGKCDVPDSEVPDSPCDGIMVDKSGARHQKVAGRNNDALAKFAFRTGTTCPTDFKAIMEKLIQEDKEGCPNPTDGITTRLISETAQATGQAGSFRSVTTRRCGKRDTDGIIFSLFGVREGSVPAAVEVIAFDDTKGVFNFYETDGRTLNFFGDSQDLLQGPGSNDDRRCANCHPAGGLVMKELDTPWMHWEGHENHPNSDKIVASSKLLGSKTSGAEFEGVVKQGNTKWNKKRIELAKGSDDAVQALLKPLFCTVELNIDNGADFKSPADGSTSGSTISGVPFDSLLDPNLAGFGSISVQATDYESVIKANGQRVEGVAGAIDTIFDYAFMEKAHVDNNFISQLKDAKILDDDLIKDVVMVDFTRPVFSDDRCGLLTFAPKLSGEDLTADKIRAGFISNLEAESPAEGSPAAVLLANLKAAGDATAHDAKVKTYTDACKALGSKPFLENSLQIVSLNRSKARELPFMEFPATIPTDNQNVDSAARLSPTTCQVITSFEAP